MRYTRYNYKKKKNNEMGKFILSFGGVIILAVLVGVFMANILSKVLPENSYGNQSAKVNSINNENNEPATGEAATNEVINSIFASIQCGYYSTEKNAKIAMDSVGNEYASFIIQDGDKYRVIAGVYDLEGSSKVMEALKQKGIECIKITFQLDSKDEAQNQIAAICNGYIDVLTTAFESDVKKVDTSDFKEWVSNLKSLEGNDNLINLKNYINNIPAEITKDNVPKELNEVYKILVNYKIK